MSAINPLGRFWMVARKPWGPGSRTEPRARYSSLDDARRVARDLARTHDAPFVILEAVEIIRPDQSGQDDNTRSLF
ncbi:hypothetical protein [uncultured Maritimibacter sp.]|jgi:hypothetical protein|uniref:hypothetical protein n=1 Tax=uncultured Maritimibacter sp. TaxID=991866 RepID=UPI0026374BED|nr:hypothetical protein [uncultured Maritimibacter sp.]